MALPYLELFITYLYVFEWTEYLLWKRLSTSSADLILILFFNFEFKAIANFSIGSLSFSILKFATWASAWTPLSVLPEAIKSTCSPN